MQRGLVMLDAFDRPAQAPQRPGRLPRQGSRGAGHWSSSTVSGAHLGGHLGGARGLPALHQRGPGRAGLGSGLTVYESNGKRPGGHLARQGPQVLRWALFEASPVRSPEELPGPRLLREGQGPHRPQPGVPVGGPQALPAGLPHPQGSRRGGHGRTRTALGFPRTQGCLRSFGEGARPAHHHDDDLLARLPQSFCRQGLDPRRPPRDRAGAVCAWGPPHQPSCRRALRPSTEIRLGAQRTSTGLKRLPPGAPMA